MLGIVTGLQSEAKLAAGPARMVISGGGRSQATQRKIATLIAQGVSGLVSFGIAGGLDPRLVCGDLVMSATVVDAAGRRYVGDPAWLQRALSIQSRTLAGHVYASDVIVETTARKQHLFDTFDVLCADMESHHVARAAELHGLPFIIIRAISDSATEVLPAAFGDGVDENGGTRVAPILQALLAGRLTLREVIQAGRSASRALQALRRAQPVLQGLSG
jgi:adenosylhomocysteine nucleosidase